MERTVYEVRVWLRGVPNDPVTHRNVQSVHSMDGLFGMVSADGSIAGYSVADVQKYTISAPSVRDIQDIQVSS